MPLASRPAIPGSLTRGTVRRALRLTPGPRRERLLRGRRRRVPRVHPQAAPQLGVLRP